MKKVQKTLSVLLLAAVTIVSLNSCKKDENVAPALGTATISGKILAEQDMTNTTTESAAGVTVQFTVNSKDQVTSPNLNSTYDNTTGSYTYSSAYPTKVYTAVTDANGMYSVTVSVGDKALPVNVKVQNITYNVIQPAGVVPSPVRGIFGGYTTSTTVYKGSIVILGDITL